jgi:hypothetical protein
VKSCAQDKAFFTTRYVFLHVYLPLSVLSTVILALHNEELDFKSKDIIHQVGKAELLLDSGNKRACTCELILETPMSNRLQDLAGDQEREGQTNPQADVDHVSWKDITLRKRQPLITFFEAARQIVVPFYPYWSIFDKEGDTFKSELTCFWNIANLLSATTGTVDFLEKAIERWKTVDIPLCTGLQTREERRQEITTITQYHNSPAYRKSWEQWIQAGAPASKALEFLAKNGLFEQQYEDQLKVRRHNESMKNKDQSKKNRTGNQSTQEKKQAYQASHKRARSQSHQGNNPWKQPNVGKEWNTREGSSSSYNSSWNPTHSNWQQGWAPDSYSLRGYYPDPNVSSHYQQHWQSYSTASSSHWPSASSSSSGASDVRNIQNYRNEGSRGPPQPRFKQEPPDDHFQ